MFISLSESCREDMLASKASNALIFESARQEVMEYLGGNKVTYCVSVPAPELRLHECLLDGA